MAAKRMAPPLRRTTRRWRTPPAITHSGEAFEGASILEEMSGQAGLVLWQSLRDVLLWASVDREERGALFAPEALEARTAALRSTAVAPELNAPLSELGRILDDSAAISTASVSAACHRIAAWADARGALATAVAFAQGAAQSAPEDAEAAYAVGRLARRRAEYARAETWFRRSVALARQSGDWTSYSLAFSGLGNLYAQCGNIPVARRLHVRSLRAARRHSLREVQGVAYHDLFVLATGAGQVEDAERYARGAYEAYGSDHPRLPILAQDVAYVWMELGRFSPALMVFQALRPLMRTPRDRAAILSNLVRAAAGAGRRDLFLETWDEAWDVITRTDALDIAAAALLELARGASTAGEYERAERAAEHALRIAAERSEAKVTFAAESVLDSIRRDRSATTQAAGSAPDAPSPAVDAFAHELVRALDATRVAP